MGFSLVGFGAGLAESVYERIEEERKFSNLALQGRLERASVLKQQQDKEAKVIEDELRQRKDRLVELGVTDQTLQKAYLSSPLAYETLEKAQKSGLNVDPAKLITVNKDKLFTGTSDELIRKATAPSEDVAPANIAAGEGRSWLSPSSGQMQRRFEQTAGARGMTLQDVARAESAARPKMPEPAATINFGLLKKEDTSGPEARLDALRGRFAAADAKDPNSPETKALKLELDALEKSVAKVVPKKLPDSDAMIKSLEADALRAGEQFGENSKEYIDAVNRLSATRSRRAALTPEQDTFAKNMSKAKDIIAQPDKYTPEERAWGKKYLDNYNAYERSQKDKGEPNEKIPSANSLISIGRTGGANAVRATYGTNAQTSKQLLFVDNADGSTSVKYSGNDPDLQRQLVRRDQEGIVNALRPYMTPDGRAMNRDVEAALRAHNIELDKDRRPVLIEAPAPAAPRPTPTVPPATPGAGRAGQAKPAAAPAASAAATPPRTQQRPAKPASVPGAPVGHSVGDYVEGKGYAVYNKQGQLIGYATE
jgi:hypothetical protein